MYIFMGSRKCIYIPQCLFRFVITNPFFVYFLIPLGCYHQSDIYSYSGTNSNSVISFSEPSLINGPQVPVPGET